MRWRAAIAAMVAGLGLLLAGSGWKIVQPGEHAVVRRWGRLVDPPLGPGLRWTWPLGIDLVDRVRTDQVRRLTIGTRADEDTGEASIGEFLTGDLNLVRVRATVQYRVTSPADFVVRADGLESILSRAAESELSAAVASRSIDEVLRGDRTTIASELVRGLEVAADRYRLGLAILGVSLTDARPPSEVAADFAAAQSAESSRARRINEAQSYAETTITVARATAHVRQEQARAAAHRELVFARARGEAFLAMLTEANRARALTIQRIYLETLRSLLEKVRRKVVLPTGDAVDLTVLGIDP